MTPIAGDPIFVLGCGVVGASAAAAWSAAGHEVWGADRRDLAPLVARGWLARQAPTEAIPKAAVVVLALPLGGILGALRRLPFRTGQLVTDVGSVKGAVMDAARALPPGVTFVGGHPLAGSAGSGFESARPDLFRGASWALVGAPVGVARLEALVRLTGAEPLACDAVEHDRVVALTSHLPQLLATALAAELETRLGSSVATAQLGVALLGAGGRAFLRLGGSSFTIWRDILAHNGGEVAAALDAVWARAGLPPEALGEEFVAAQRWARRLRPDEL